MDKGRIAEIIAQLKVVRSEKGYSYQKIVGMTEDIGEYRSLSTVKRVFTDDDHSFKWDTIRPIATVLLGVGFETPKPSEDPDQPQLYYAEIEALKTVVEAKGELLVTRERDIEFLKKQLRRQQIFTTISTMLLGAMIIIGFLWID